MWPVRTKECSDCEFAGICLLLCCGEVLSWLTCPGLSKALRARSLRLGRVLLSTIGFSISISRHWRAGWRVTELTYVYQNMNLGKKSKRNGLKGRRRMRRVRRWKVDENEKTTKKPASNDRMIRCEGRNQWWSKVTAIQWMTAGQVVDDKSWKKDFEWVKKCGKRDWK